MHLILVKADDMTAHTVLIIKTVAVVVITSIGLFFLARAMKKADHQMMMDFKNENWDE